MPEQRYMGMKEHGISRKRKIKKLRKIESYGSRVEMRCGNAEVEKCRQATSSSWVLFAMLGSLDFILRGAELPDTPDAASMPNSAWFHSHSRPLHKFLLLFILLLQLQMPAPPGKIAFIVLGCILDNLESLSLSLAQTLCHRPPSRNVMRINPGALLVC